jgi:hypothetical protein
MIEYFESNGDITVYLNFDICMLLFSNFFNWFFVLFLKTEAYFFDVLTSDENGPKANLVIYLF